MSKKKSPFVGLSEEDVRRIENNYFVLQFGGDFIIEDECYLFTKKEAERLYGNTLKNLLGIMEDGDERDRKYAVDLIAGLFILPMRLN